MNMVKESKGLTLTELLFAALIIVIVIVAIVQCYLTTLHLSGMSKEETIAMTHLINMIERIKCTPFSDITADFPDGISDGPVGNNYATIVGGYALPVEHIVVTYVNQYSDPLEINVGTSWQDRRGAIRTKYLVTKRTR
jgi:hypothetical protein